MTPALPPDGPRLAELPTPLREALESRQLPGLHGLRALAAALVVFFHLGVPRVPGPYGVLAFFVLSGFLITWLLLHEERQRGSIDLRSFYVRRSLRIFPAFYAYWLAAMLLWVVANRYGAKPVQWGQALAAFTYTTNYYQALNGDPNSLLSHTWSLAVEEQFYLLWPLAFSLLGRHRVLGLVLAIGAITTHRHLLYWVHGDLNWAYEAFDARADHLLIGCLLATALWQGRWPRLWQRVATPQAAWVTVLALLVVTQGDGRIPWFRNLVGFTVEPILTAMLIVQTMAGRNWPLLRVFNHPRLQLLGDLSYSTYLYQQMSIGFAARMPHGLGLLTGLVITYAGAAASYRWVEQPFLRLKARWSRR